MVLSWDPDLYLRFGDLRARPGLELIARIPDIQPKTVVDLGCGAGFLTACLGDRWPHAELIGVDSSLEMLERAGAEYSTITWERAEIETWEPAEPVDLLFSNATLHWLIDHREVFTRLRSYLAPRGVLAVQMPDNWREPTHTIPETILDEGDWPPEAISALIRDRVTDAENYRAWIQPADIDMWRTTYYQQLSGRDPVWHWVTGTALRPVLDHLAGNDRARFESTCKAVYRSAYPEDSEGITVLPFSRLFIVAKAR
jgi:trans-aconitate 2-methyltransferase